MIKEITKGFLKKYGYKLNENFNKRKIKLNKILFHEGKKNTINILYRAKYSRKNNKISFNILQKDLQYIKNKKLKKSKSVLKTKKSKKKQKISFIL